MKPFFILGAPRSGTTMLRNIFNQIDDLYSPEETHFFRWAAPLRGNEFHQYYKNNRVLKKHREIDGIDEELFQTLVKSSSSKAELTRSYCQKVAESKGASYWFEKTPQNVYGLPLIIDQFPDAKIIHIVRHPLSVIKSLLVGKVMKLYDFTGAVNYWSESASIINVMKPLMKDQLIEIKYENLQTDPDTVFDALKSHIFDNPSITFDLSHIKQEVDIPKEFFTSDQLQTIQNICGKYAAIYDYDIV